MKTYKDFPKTYLGASDISCLLLRGCDALDELKFGGDGAFYAYMVDQEAEIGSHYELRFECRDWLWIYDDQTKRIEVRADTIQVYRGGDMGCIVYAPGAEFKKILG